MANAPKSQSIPPVLAIIAGSGLYPTVFAQAARNEGVSRLVVLAFPGETDPGIEPFVDQVTWVPVGHLRALLDALRSSGAKMAVMVGQITPQNLFSMQADDDMRRLLATLPERNAHSIFGALAEAVHGAGVKLAPASTFMESTIPGVGVLSERPPTPAELADIRLGFKVAKATSELDIGQTVVIKAGTVLAVEAFEGTDETITRAGKLAGAGSVVVKVAKASHDMRFDIPVIGMTTFARLERAQAATLALEANRTIILERETAVAEANRLGISLIMVDEHSLSVTQ